MFKKFLFALIVLFTMPLASAKVLLVVGDSISAGFGVEQERGWVALLKTRLKEQGYNYEVINASISGDTTANGLARIEPLLLEHKPSVVVIELGGNDGLRATPPKQIKQNLIDMVGLAKQINAKVLLIGIQLPPNYGVEYLERFEAVFPLVAKEQQVPLLTSIVANTGARDEYMQADGIHPNTKGQLILLDDVWEQLKPLLSKQRVNR